MDKEFPSAPSNAGLSVRPLTRGEVLALVVRLTIFGSVSYFTFKWLFDMMDPTRKQKAAAKKQADALMRRIGVKVNNLSEYEMVIASQIVDPLSLAVSWHDIGGLNETIAELQESVILLMQRGDLFEGSALRQPPKGILLHGPPGCGKTMIAKATAKEAGARFINLQVSSLTDKWYGESQKLAGAVFSLAYKLQPAIIFIDEIDSFLRSRDSTDHECTAMMKAQFMSLWDGLISSPSARVIIMGATNRPQDVDRAILRRMPATYFVPPPTAGEREHILEIILSKESVLDDVDIPEIARLTEGFSGSDLRELCRVAATYSVKELVRGPAEERRAATCLRPISAQDMTAAVTRLKGSKSLYSPAPPHPFSSLHHPPLD